MMTKTQAEALADRLRAQGFDNVRVTYEGPSDISRGVYAVTLGCSQCEALAVNGVATHEGGCPNTSRTCRECGAEYLSRHVSLCPDCTDDDTA